MNISSWRLVGFDWTFFDGVLPLVFLIRLWEGSMAFKVS